MSTARRFYIYAVSGIALQALTWAVIALVRNVLIRNLDPPTTAVAFEIAVIIIGLPVFFVHWLWAQRLARSLPEEREAELRSFYLYATLAGFLGPFLSNVFDLVGNFLGASSSEFRSPTGLSSGEVSLFHLLPVVVLSGLYLFHHRILAEDAQSSPKAVRSTAVRRLYVYGVSGAGLYLSILGIILLFRWILFQIGGGSTSIRQDLGFAQEITRLLVGIPLWVIFWRWAQKLFDSGNSEEELSGLRKFYLYTAITVGAFGVVGNATGILAGLFRRLLDLPASGDIRVPLSSILGMGILWAFHALVLRDDAQKVAEFPRQASIRRLSMYLVAGGGLIAVLIGLGGILSVLLRSFDGGFGSGLREELSWFTAGLIAGFPVWLIPWRQLQAYAISPEQTGFEERRSTVRKIYLYVFLFIATMTVISSAVYIVFRILSMILGEGAPTLSELGQAIAFSVIAVGVLIYHGLTLRNDNRLTNLEKTKKLQDMAPLVLDLEGSELGPSIVAALKSENPDLALETTFLPGCQSTHEDKASVPPLTDPILEPTAAASLEKSISASQLIIGPWQLFSPGGGSRLLTRSIEAAIFQSTAHKLIIPTHAERWDWAGVDLWDQAALIRQTTHAIKQIMEGKAVQAHRPLRVGAIIGIVLGVLFLLLFVVAPLLFLFFEYY